MYVRTKPNVRTPVGITDSNPVKVGLHQGSAFSQFLFKVVLDELSRSIQKIVLWCIHMILC
ncbi:hypothetical protein HanPSC8_Chr07g0305191 [Helianthus annuus]|nr:hypothetical protein HanPSC8_Chr07g0305191 [Helianthus annuus]